ncbi:hypothetical protein [Alloactinosynnema sp. L-07]|nr:hypothetical protein [Alloactinosynnema sp. L-07]
MSSVPTGTRSSTGIGVVPVADGIAHPERATSPRLTNSARTPPIPTLARVMAVMISGA